MLHGGGCKLKDVIWLVLFVGLDGGVEGGDEYVILGIDDANEKLVQYWVN